tara:strand:+ start:1073 stop:1186 length:114 start_codon:yes stop_codon:yes gene_type:complete
MEPALTSGAALFAIIYLLNKFFIPESNMDAIAATPRK